MPGRGRGRPRLPPGQRKTTAQSTAECRKREIDDKGLEQFRIDDAARVKRQSDKVCIDRLIP